jgi:hypothetical protein
MKVREIQTCLGRARTLSWCKNLRMWASRYGVMDDDSESFSKYSSSILVHLCKQHTEKMDVNEGDCRVRNEDVPWVQNPVLKNIKSRRSSSLT